MCNMAPEKKNKRRIYLEDVLAAVLLLALVDDLEEFFEGDSSVARDISLLNNLVHIGLCRMGCRVVSVLVSV